ncbi:MAG: helix-turn-helix domain-containing protein [Rhizobiales bacterium]|nr:helix-turn-helix domain-containing protein [Hyphomicrobiales bacterium]
MNNIKELRLLKKLSVQNLADKIDTTVRQIYRLEKGERNLTQDWMVRLAKVLECEPADIISDATTNILPEGAIPMPSGFALLPVLGAVQAGTWLEVDDQQVEVCDLEHIKVPLVADYSADKHFLLKVIGDSMNKKIPNGYYAICVCADGVNNGFPSVGNMVVVERTRFNGSMKEVTIKRFKVVDGRDVLIPESYDDKYKPIYPDQEKDEGTEVKFVAKVVGTIGFDL